MLQENNHNSHSMSSRLTEHDSEQQQRTAEEEDLVWVVVIRGKKSALYLCSIQFVGSLISFSLIADVEIPLGSYFLFVTMIVTFSTCGIFLIPPFLKSFLNRFQSLQEKSSYLVFLIAFWAFMIAFLSFLAAALASKAFEECRNLPAGQCAKMQAAISIGFIVSFSIMGSFLVVFLGSIIPKDITVKTYVRGLGRAATLAAARGATGRVIDHGFESIPLDVVLPGNRSFSEPDWPISIGSETKGILGGGNNNNKLSRNSSSPLMSRNLVNQSMDSEHDVTMEEIEDNSSIDDRKSIDAMEII